MRYIVSPSFKVGATVRIWHTVVRIRDRMLVVQAIFLEVPHDLFKYTTADENGDYSGVWEQIVGPLSLERRTV